MRYHSVCADIHGPCIQGRVCLQDCDGGCVVQICLYVSDRRTEACHMQIVLPGGACMALPQLPICGHVGKMTYLEGRWNARQAQGMRICISPIPACGGESAQGIFCPACEADRCAAGSPPVFPVWHGQPFPPHHTGGCSSGMFHSPSPGSQPFPTPCRPIRPPCFPHPGMRRT